MSGRLWQMRLLAVLVVLLAPGLLSVQAAERSQPTDIDTLAKSYKADIRPLVVRYCQECHAGEQVEAEIDLSIFKSLTEIRKQPVIWQKVRVMLDSGQMPPPDADQPTATERTLLSAWVHSYLKVEAATRAGDPGRVVLRRLSNVEYTNTLRELTGLADLQPAREFPVDGAAGEGFTNTGNALVMSPSLITKYLDAAKDVADHVVLLPDGIRFSPHTTRRDRTNDAVASIRSFYQQFVNEDGRFPLKEYLLALLEEREALQSGATSIENVAGQRGLSGQYLKMLWTSLSSREPSLLLDQIRTRWRESQPADVDALVAEITTWQNALWKFSSVGHIGKVGGPKAWLEAVDPLVTQQELRFKIPETPVESEIRLVLQVADAGDGSENDFVILQQPRFVSPGRPDLLLRDLRELSRDRKARRQQMFAHADRYLNAAASITSSQADIDYEKLASEYAVDADALRAWLDYLGVTAGGTTRIEGHFTEQIAQAAGYAFIQGWGSNNTPSLLANSSDQEVRIPGLAKPHGIVVHPAPTLQVAAGWRSPVTGSFHIDATITHAHPECGNGVAWSLELRRGITRQRLAVGISQRRAAVKVAPIEEISIQAGDLVSLVVGPRDGNHSCDLTAIDFQLTDTSDGGKTWNLANDVSNDILAGNPHDDRFGHPDVWHFYVEPIQGNGQTGPVIPTGSLLAKWQTAQDGDEKQKLAVAVQTLLNSGAPADPASPDAALYRQLSSLGGPLFSGDRKKSRSPEGSQTDDAPSTESADDWGLDAAMFGRHPNANGTGTDIDSASLCVQAPSTIEIRLPADIVAGCELVTTAVLDPKTGTDGSVQVQLATAATQTASSTEAPPAIQPGRPILTTADSPARQRLAADLDEFRQLFPTAAAYTRIVPVDEVVTLTLFYREDTHLSRLALDSQQQTKLDRLWDELHYISHDALTLVDAYIQLLEFASQDGDPSLFEPLRKPIHDRAANFRRLLTETEPQHLDAVIRFAQRAYRRPLSEAESHDLRNLYRRLRAEELSHEEAIRLVLARVLVSPAYLYRIEKPQPGKEPSPVSNWELASRLSYFLWASPPDERLLQLAADEKLVDTKVLVAETRRMLHDARTRQLATEFACQWLHINDFNNLDEKSERHFPTFIGLREAMYEESIQFFTDMFQYDGSVLDILDADHTFLNQQLAEHYGIPDITGPEWRRVENVKQYARGGVLAQATTLSKQSGASRTSPILRGNWISEVLLGERLPRPPKDVPQLPEDETAIEGLTVRQLVEKHSSDPKCVICHQRIDAFGFSLESFDAIGRLREKDLADRPIDTRVTTMDGAKFDGLDGLRKYLLTVRRDAFLRQFCRKLLGYALGRAIQLSDEPLLDTMQAELESHDFRVTAAIEAIVKSPQFRNIRGLETAYDD